MGVAVSNTINLKGADVYISGKLVPLADEQATITRIRELRSTGATLAAIAENLNVAGIVTKRSGAWFPSTVRNVLQSTLQQ